MNAPYVERHFAAIGARVKLGESPWLTSGGVRLDIASDRKGEFFDITTAPDADLAVVDVRRDIRHLLLLSNQSDGNHKFLCGHDERHWFVAAVPEAERAANVATAMEALKPEEVRHRQARLQLPTRKRNRRRNEAFVRQGEWFFLPMPEHLKVDPKAILSGEPLRRGGGKPHWVDELVRMGGTTVYVSRAFPDGLLEHEYRALLQREPQRKRDHWVTMRRNPRVLVRGKIRHADHKTIVLPHWHRVLMNTETEAVAMRNVAFLD
jgi:hypothetical protein